jgi:uncharacterized protein (DUF1015 family)
MVTIYPFAGLHPSDEAFSFVPSVPYDIISTADAAAEIARNDKTLLRVIRTDAELPDLDPYDIRIYERSREMFARMKADNLLVRDENLAFYIYRITLGDEIFIGLISCVSVAEYKDDTIKKHELTRYDKEMDRTRHIDALSAHTGQVFLLYKDPGSIHAYISNLVDVMQPFGEYGCVGGPLHQIYRIVEPAEITRLRELFAQVPNLYIADGHHRAKSSVNVYDCRKKDGRCTPDVERFMGVLFAHDKVRIHGYHRLIRDLAGMNSGQFLEELAMRFTVTPIKMVDITKSVVPPITNIDDSTHIVHLYLENQWYELTRSVDPSADVVARLDVSVLQELVLGDILCITDPRGDSRISFVGGIVPLADVMKGVDAGEYSAVFVMQPITAQEVIGVADNAMIMPPKSTWFEPKLLSGMVIHEIH